MDSARPDQMKGARERRKVRKAGFRAPKVVVCTERRRSFRGSMTYCRAYVHSRADPRANNCQMKIYLSANRAGGCEASAHGTA